MHGIGRALTQRACNERIAASSVFLHHVGGEQLRRILDTGGALKARASRGNKVTGDRGVTRLIQILLDNKHAQVFVRGSNRSRRGQASTTCANYHDVRCHVCCHVCC